MNIFFVDVNPILAARYLCNKHVLKMVIESAQLLSNVHHFYHTELSKTGTLYKPTHINHPCSKWAREAVSNYRWLWRHAMALAEEYTYRYIKIHKTQSMIKTLELCPDEQLFPSATFTLPAQAMPETYKCEDTIKAYRDYYVHEKSSFAKWTRRKAPDWYESGVRNNVS